MELLTLVSILPLIPCSVIQESLHLPKLTCQVSLLKGLRQSFKYFLTHNAGQGLVRPCPAQNTWNMSDLLRKPLESARLHRAFVKLKPCWRETVPPPPGRRVRERGYTRSAKLHLLRLRPQLCNMLPCFGVGLCHCVFPQTFQAHMHVHTPLTEEWNEIPTNCSNSLGKGNLLNQRSICFEDLKIISIAYKFFLQKQTKNSAQISAFFIPFLKQ